MKPTTTAKTLLAALAITFAASACSTFTSAEDGPEVAVNVIDEGQTSETDDGLSSGSEGDTAEATGDQESPTSASSGVPQQPDCAAGTPSSYTPSQKTDTFPLETNQVMEGAVEEFTADNYKIQLCEGQQVIFRGFADCEADPFMNWTLIGPQGVSDDFPFFSGLSGCDTPADPIEVSETGEYILEFTYGQNDAGVAKSYRFEVLNVAAPDIFTIENGSEVRPGQPGAGAGALEFPGSEDRYKIQLTEGQRISIKGLADCEADPFMSWTLISPKGESDNLPFFSGLSGCDTVAGPIEVPETGEYTLEFSYGEDSVETAKSYGFDIVVN